MPKLVVRLAVLVLFFIPLHGIQAEVRVTYVSEHRPIFSVAFPDGWLVKTGQEVDPAIMPDGMRPMPRVVSAMPEDAQILWFAFWVPPEIHTLKEAEDHLASLKGVLLDAPRVTQTRNQILNGMPSRTLRGQGTKEDEMMDFFVLMFQPHPDTVGIALYIGRPEARQTHRGELEGLIASIIPAPPANPASDVSSAQN